MTKKRRLTKKTIDDKLKKLSLVFSFEGVRKRIKGSIIILDSSMAEHPAVNRRVVGSNPTRGAMNSKARASGLFRSRACSSTVEQGTHNPLVLGSNPGGPTILQPYDLGFCSGHFCLSISFYETCPYLVHKRF